MILANTYHLHLRPGDEAVRQAGGLHRFEAWDGAMLTDSGGFQVFSLRDISKITDDGVVFQSYIDGSRHFFSPENVIEMQHNLGADVIMMFDECPPATADIPAVVRAVERTIEWARRGTHTHLNTPFHFGYPQALFGIVQGGVYPDLREKCARALVELDLPGYAMGGLAVGESMEKMYATVAATEPFLPQHKPRYLMGVGMPENILECIERGIDMFDCVLPTRNARNGAAFTYKGKINIRNAAHTADFTHPLEDGCTCYACANFSRGYIRHLFMAGEILGIRLLTMHNIHFYEHLTAQARRTINDGTFKEWKSGVLASLSTATENGSEKNDGATHEK